MEGKKRFVFTQEQAERFEFLRRKLQDSITAKEIDTYYGGITELLEGAEHEEQQ